MAKLNVWVQPRLVAEQQLIIYMVTCLIIMDHSVLQVNHMTVPMAAAVAAAGMVEPMVMEPAVLAAHPSSQVIQAVTLLTHQRVLILEHPQR
jgi:hypothetical protein